LVGCAGEDTFAKPLFSHHKTSLNCKPQTLFPLLSSILDPRDSSFFHASFTSFNPSARGEGLSFFQTFPQIRSKSLRAVSFYFSFFPMDFSLRLQGFLNPSYSPFKLPNRSSKKSFPGSRGAAFCKCFLPVLLINYRRAWLLSGFALSHYSAYFLIWD